MVAFVIEPRHLMARLILLFHVPSFQRALHNGSLRSAPSVVLWNNGPVSVFATAHTGAEENIPLYPMSTSCTVRVVCCHARHSSDIYVSFKGRLVSKAQRSFE